MGVQGRQHDPVDPGGDRVLDELDLLDPVVLLLGPEPDHFHIPQLLGRLERAGVDRLPELVGRPLGDHDHSPLPRLDPRRLAPLAFSAWGGWTSLATWGSL